MTFEKMLNVYESKIVGFSLANKNRSWYIPLHHNNGSNCPLGLLKEILRRLDGKTVWAHNVKHELLAGASYLLRDCVVQDSMVAAWLANLGVNGQHGLKALAKAHLGADTVDFTDVAKNGAAATDPAALADYAGNDALWSLQLGEIAVTELRHWGLAEHFHNIEMPFVRVLADMERAGMHVFAPAIGDLAADLSGTVTQVQEYWDFLLPGVSVSSTQQIAAVMWGKHWPTKGVEKTKTGKLQVTSEVLRGLVDTLPPGSLGYEVARLKLEYQAAHKYLSTYTTNLLDMQDNYSDNRLHPSFHHTGTVTGRLSCSSPNLQNIPVRSGTGKLIKRCFVPAEGNVFVAADYSQIELRVLAHYIGGALADAYKQNRDVHAQTAEGVGCSRDKGKTLNFAVVYGAGPKKVSKMLGVSYVEAKRYLDKFAKLYPEIGQLKDKVISVTAERGYIKTLTGRRRYIPELQTNGEERWRGERLALNTPIQGSAADIMKLAMLRVHSKLPADWRMVAQVHDELTLEVPKEHLRDAERLLQSELEAAYNLKVPLVAEPKSGTNWAECK